MEESGFRFNVANQYTATLAANLIMLGHGCVIAWFSPSLPILMSDETPLKNGPLSNEELSWLGSINNLGALIGILTFGFITNFIGCKRSMIFLAFPSAAFWLLIYFGNTYYQLLFARCLAGITGGGINTTTLLFVSEIANDNIRGKLGSLATLSRNTGVLIMFIVGAVVDYHSVPCIFILFPVVYLILFSLLPNTPQFYLLKGDLQKAENALKFYKTFKGKSEYEEIAFQKEFARLKLLSKERKEDESVQFSDFVEKKALNGLWLCILLGWWTQFPGALTFLNYGILIFEKAGASQIDPYTSSILLAFAQMMGGVFSTQLADSLGRKLSMVISFFGSAVGLFILALYLYLIQNGYDLSDYNLLPVVCLSFVMFISSAGVYALFAVCFVELLPTKIRTIGLTICILFTYAAAFSFIKIFPILLEMIDLYGCMIIYMVGSVFGALFVIFALEETKGKSLDTLKSTENK